jgi:hypothetical protein
VANLQVFPDAGPTWHPGRSATLGLGPKTILASFGEIHPAIARALDAPEGTRVPHGEEPPLRSGFAGLYRALGLPVVPVAVDSGRLWTRGLLKRRGVIHFRIGEPIQPGLKREDIEARVHAAINALN